MTHKIANMVFAVILSAGIALAILTLCGILLFVLDKNPLTYRNIPFPTSQNVYHSGDSVRSMVQRCSSQENQMYSFSSQLRSTSGAVVALLTSSNVVADKGCTSFWSVPQVLPDSLQQGTYHIEYIVFVPTRFRTHVISGVRTTSFMVR